MTYIGSDNNEYEDAELGNMKRDRMEDKDTAELEAATAELEAAAAAFDAAWTQFLIEQESPEPILSYCRFCRGYHDARYMDRCPLYRSPL